MITFLNSLITLQLILWLWGLVRVSNSHGSMQYGSLIVNFSWLWHGWSTAHLGWIWVDWFSFEMFMWAATELKFDILRMYHLTMLLVAVLLSASLQLAVVKPDILVHYSCYNMLLLNIRAKAGGIKWPWECNTTWWLTSCAMGFMCLAILNKCSGLLKTCGGKSCNGLIKFISSDIDAFQMETSTLTLLRSGEQFPCGKTTSGKSKFFLVGT